MRRRGTHCRTNYVAPGVTIRLKPSLRYRKAITAVSTFNRCVSVSFLVTLSSIDHVIKTIMLNNEYGRTVRLNISDSDQMLSTHPRLYYGPNGINLSALMMVIMSL